MMNAGIVVSDAATAAFQSLKKKKTHRFIIFQIQNEKEVVPTILGERSAAFEEFQAAVVANQPCYGVFDLEYQRDGIDTDKIMFVSFVPDSLKPKARMVYASTSETLKNDLELHKSALQVNDVADLTFEAFLAKANQK